MQQVCIQADLGLTLSGVFLIQHSVTLLPSIYVIAICLILYPAAFLAPSIYVCTELMGLG